MALGKSPYPKTTVKKIIKAHSGINIKKNADVTVWGHTKTWDERATDCLQIFLDYVLFMDRCEQLQDWDA